MTSKVADTTETAPDRRFATQSDLRPAPTPSLATALLRTARPKQWVKNVLVLAAPFAAGQALDASVIAQAVAAFVAFTLASSATYFVNDALDYEADRKHPRKKHRPIAAGHVSVTTAWTAAATCLVLAMAISLLTGALAFTGLLAGYVVMTLAYSVKLKHVAVIDLACVAAGFVLRMIGGGLATGIVLSEWFLTVACFASLFIVAGKRYAEMREVGEGNTASRAVLDDYTPAFLRVVYVMAMAVAVGAYCQWTFERGDVSGHHIWYQLSAVPWVTGLLRYALLLEKGQGGAPEEIVVSDRTLQVLGGLWAVLFMIGVYV